MSKCKLIVFDLDGTLSESKSELKPDMAEALGKLLKVKKVAVISGAAFPQFEWQFLKHMTSPIEDLANLFILPTDGTQLWVMKEGTWQEAYEKDFTEEEKAKIMAAFDTALHANNFNFEGLTGKLIEDRKSEIAFSGLGMDATFEPKQAWDPDQAKRKKITDVLITLIPEFEVRIGGTTTIEVTKKGLDKAYGVEQLSKYTHIPVSEMLYVGDALYEGGNDESAKKSGIETRQVSGPSETMEVIEQQMT